jgi:hypothetical protein
MPSLAGSASALTRSKVTNEKHRTGILMPGSSHRDRRAAIVARPRVWASIGLALTSWGRPM